MPMPRTEHAIRFGPYSAIITERSGALRELRHGGRDLVVGFGADGPIPDYRGVVCAPWPNRVAATATAADISGRHQRARTEHGTPRSGAGCAVDPGEADGFLGHAPLPGRRRTRLSGCAGRDGVL